MYARVPFANFDEALDLRWESLDYELDCIFFKRIWNFAQTAKKERQEEAYYRYKQNYDETDRKRWCDRQRCSYKS